MIDADPFVGCNHPETSIIRAIASNGVVHVREVCDQCAKLVRAVSRAKLADEGIDFHGLPEVQIEKLAEWREELFQAWLQQYRDRREAEREDWRIRYDDYLRSPEWRSIRARVLERANGLCEGCLIAPATQVHHVTYRHVFAEFAFELRALCSACHDRIHAEDTSR